MNLLEKINQQQGKDINKIVEQALNEIIAKSEKSKILGFGGDNNVIYVHKGFIFPDFRIRYNNLGLETYSMKTTDYFYEFAKELKQYGIKNNGQLIGFLETFINKYFDFPKYNYDARSQIFHDIAWQNTTTDEEYFEQLENNEIGDLKGKGIAMCTEKAALAQNLLSLFGIETFYCMGCINNDGKTEPHCFNIAKAKETFVLIDYSIPCPVKENNKVISYLPFQGIIELSEIEAILTGETIKTYSSYEWVKSENGYKKVNTEKQRNYIIGSFEIKKDETQHL